MAMAECRNASNPYHECSRYCVEWIAKNKPQQQQQQHSAPAEEGIDRLRKLRATPEQERNGGFQGDKREVEDAAEAQVAEEYQQQEEVEPENLTERQKKLRLLQRKLADARRANQTAVVMEKRREEAPKEERGMSKQKWFDEKQKTVEKRLEHGGLDKSKVYMLETQEAAEAKYEKWDKEPAAFGWDVFNQRSLYRAYKKRTKDIPYTVEDYAKAKEADPDFYRDETSLQYGKSTAVPEENVNKMVDELEQRRGKRKEFSRRRKYHEEKDIDSINDRNEHFNRKIERAFGKYTVEIKNNLERGTALPD